MVLLLIDVVARRTSVLVDVRVCEKFSPPAQRKIPFLQPFQLCRCVLSLAQLNTLGKVSAVRSQHRVQVERSVFAGQNVLRCTRPQSAWWSESHGIVPHHLRKSGKPQFLPARWIASLTSCIVTKETIQRSFWRPIAAWLYFLVIPVILFDSSRSPFSIRLLGISSRSPCRSPFSGNRRHLSLRWQIF